MFESWRCHALGWTRDFFCRFFVASGGLCPTRNQVLSVYGDGCIGGSDGDRGGSVEPSLLNRGGASQWQYDRRHDGSARCACTVQVNLASRLSRRLIAKGRVEPQSRVDSKNRAPFVLYQRTLFCWGARVSSKSNGETQRRQSRNQKYRLRCFVVVVLVTFVQEKLHALQMSPLICLPCDGNPSKQDQPCPETTATGGGNAED